MDAQVLNSGRSRVIDKRKRSSEEGVTQAQNLSIHKEADVKKAQGPAVSNTYVAENMEVVNHYHF